jgi:predicted acylesterase/phospholipase RssA
VAAVKRTLSQIRILSVDGGGVRGIMPAHWLTELEGKLQVKCEQTIFESFDWFAGTSTGAIVAAGLACGLPANDILALYQSKAKRIFSTFWGGRIWNPFRWSGLIFPKHSDGGLNKVLKETFGDQKMGDVGDGKRLLIVSYEGGSRTPMVFDSEDPRFADVLIWQACRASAAAPTYLPDAEFAVDDVDFSFLDGGVVANDPAAIALAKVLELRLDREAALVVSFGTGQSGTGFNPKRFWKLSGAAPWLSSLPTTLMEGSNGGYGSIVGDLLDDRHYFRFDTPLRLASPALDDASTKQVSALSIDATNYWNLRRTTEQCDKLLAQIECGPPLDLSSFKGTWESEYTWTDKAGDIKSLKELAQVEVLAGQFLRGKILSESQYPGTFELSQVGDKVNLVGHWYNKYRTKASTFVFTVDPSDNTRLEGVWIGCGDENSPGGHYQGTWTLTRAR